MSSPHRQPAQKGEGVYESKCRWNILGGKYPDLAICVRTQIDVYITGCIVIPPNNKPRLKRFIYLYNGRYTRKQDGTRLKMNIYAIILL